MLARDLGDEYEYQAEIFRRLREDDANNKCIECGIPFPTWASVPLGVFLCIECAARHRGFGTHLSFVRSISLDKWTEKQLLYMQLGGNDKAKAYFFHDTESRLPIKWDTESANSYRKELRSLVYKELGEPLPDDSNSNLSIGNYGTSQSISSSDYFNAQRPTQENVRRRKTECCTIL